MPEAANVIILSAHEVYKCLLEYLVNHGELDLTKDDIRYWFVREASGEFLVVIRKEPK